MQTETNGRKGGEKREQGKWGGEEACRSITPSKLEKGGMDVDRWE